MANVKWVESRRKITNTTFDKGMGKIFFKDVYQVVVQKSDYTRIKVYNHEDGSISRTQDEIQVPAFGPSSVPFDVELYISKENSGDSDYLHIFALVKKVVD